MIHLIHKSFRSCQIPKKMFNIFIRHTCNTSFAIEHDVLVENVTKMKILLVTDVQCDGILWFFLQSCSKFIDSISWLAEQIICRIVFTSHNKLKVPYMIFLFYRDIDYTVLGMSLLAAFFKRLMTKYLDCIYTKMT